MHSSPHSKACAIIRSEMVVVDDGSTDGRRPPPHAACRRPRVVRVVTQRTRAGFSARQAGLRGATGEWALLLDTRVRLGPQLTRVRCRAAPCRRTGLERSRPRGGRGQPDRGILESGRVRRVEAVPGAPIATSFGLENFDNYPKGTGCFLAPRALLSRRSTRSPADTGPPLRQRRHGSDPMDRREGTSAPLPRLRLPLRSAIDGFVLLQASRLPGDHIRHGHLRPESRFFRGCRRVLSPPVRSSSFSPSEHQAVTPILLGAGALAGGAVAAAGGCSPYEVRSVAALSPLYAVGHGAGMWRGLRAASCGRDPEDEDDRDPGRLRDDGRTHQTRPRARKAT